MIAMQGLDEHQKPRPFRIPCDLEVNGQSGGSPGASAAFNGSVLLRRHLNVANGDISVC